MPTEGFGVPAGSPRTGSSLRPDAFGPVREELAQFLACSPRSIQASS